MTCIVWLSLYPHARQSSVPGGYNWRVETAKCNESYVFGRLGSCLDGVFQLIVDDENSGHNCISG